MIGLEVKSSLAELDKTLEEYANATGKNMAQVLAKKGKSLGIALFKSYEESAPSPGIITAEAIGRHWAMGRRGGRRGISAVAERLAARYMGGQHTIMAELVGDWNNSDIRSIRVGKRGKIISGGKRGRGGRAAGFEEAQSLLKTDDRYNGSGFVNNKIKFNKRNVEVFFEVKLRERGRLSIAVPWLVAKKVSGKAIHARWTQNNENASIPWGSQAELKGDREMAWFALRSSAPGQEKYQENAIRAFTQETEDMRDYLLELARTGLSHAAYKAAKKAGTL